MGMVRYLRESFVHQVEEEQCRALVLVKDPKVQDYVDNLKLKNAKSHNIHPSSLSGFNAGYKDGKKVMVRRGIEESSKSSIT